MPRSVIILLTVLMPGVALAHAAERGLILLLPTEYYLVGGAGAVAISFAVLALFPRRPAQTIPPASPHARHAGVLAQLAGWLGFAAFWWLIAAGLLGSRDPLTNPLPLTMWTIVWIGFVALAVLVGDFWKALNPWHAPARVLARDAVRPIPDAVGYWPAIISLGAIAWFEIVDLAPDDPARLARVAAVYWAVHFGFCLIYGPGWLRRGEALSVVLALIGAMAPLRRKRPFLAWPGTRLTRRAALPLSGWLFVCLMISTVTFDGLAGTFWWLGLIGINPLEFPGRSAVVWPNTAGLAGVWAAMSAAFAACITLGWLMAGRTASLPTSLGRIALSLLPIALAYHLSHYLTYFLVNGQYALLAATDPLGTGADLLGLGAYPVTTSFLNNLADVQLIWRVQVGLIVGGHLMAVIIAHAIAQDLYPARREVVLSQLPLAALMVAYTLLGLWLLSAPTAV